MVKRIRDIDDNENNYHRFWEVPKCSCPSLDNMDAYPYRRVVVQNCKLHGWDE